MPAAVFAVVAFPQAVGAQGLTSPPNEGSEQVAVVEKLGVVEERAAPNMLAEGARVNDEPLGATNTEHPEA